jgi:hypothetical protein
MSVTINVQPNPRTSVQFVQTALQPPSLVIFDGNATVFFSPAAVPGGVMSAEVFARELAGAVLRWGQACHDAATLAQAPDPLGLVGEVAAEFGRSTETG